jgi:hypothetical protein
MANFKGALDYIDVATRIVEFREKYPTGSLRQESLEFVRDFAGKDWVVFTAAAYRTPDDQCPGIGTAWEPVPGPTQFTRDSEVQNAETAAWGRAMVAALAVDTKKGIASAEEVRNRSAADAPKVTETKPVSVPDGFEQSLADAGTLEDLTALWQTAVAGGFAGALQNKFAARKKALTS